MAAKIWSPKTVGWVWLAILAVTLMVYAAIWLAGGAPVQYYYALVIPGSIILGLMVFSLVERGTRGWGWIPVGLTLAMLWGALWVVLQFFVFLMSRRSYRRRW